MLYTASISKHSASPRAYDSKSLPREVETIRVEIIEDSNIVGYVDLALTRYGFWETHSFLDEHLRGFGLGTAMYSTALLCAIAKGFEVKSSLNVSRDATRVWTSMSLNSKFNIVKKKRRFCVVGIKSCQT